MKILVTGGAGFIGMNLIKELLKEGHNVHSLDNYDSGLESNEGQVLIALHNKKAQFLKIDFKNAITKIMEVIKYRILC